MKLALDIMCASSCVGRSFFVRKEILLLYLLLMMKF